MNNRRNRILTFLLAWVLAFSQMPLAFGLTGDTFGDAGVASGYSHDEILVTYDSRYSTTRLEALGDGGGIMPLAEEPGGLVTALVPVAETLSVEQAIEVALREPGVVAAQPNYFYTACDTPNDPELENSSGWWWLSNVNAYNAWDHAKTNNQVTVAVFDSGVYVDHEDLSANLDLQHAWDAIYDRPMMVSAALEGGGGEFGPDAHGTHVSGIIGSVANNGVGGAGVSYNASVLPIRVFEFYPASGTMGTFSAFLILAYDYLLDLQGSGQLTNLRVINMSLGAWGSIGDDDLFQNRIQLAKANGIMTIAAAGNRDYNYPKNYPFYPSDWPDVFSVMATRSDNTIDSNYAFNEDKNICAPGIYIFSTTPTGYNQKSGTSMSSACISGIAALIWAANPNLSVQQVERILVETAIPMAANSGAVGYGRVNAEAAVLAAIAERGVCEIGNVGYADFSDALAAVEDGQTIKLLTDIDHNNGVVISNKSVTFDVNGFVLNIIGSTDDEHALQVINGGSVLLADSSTTKTGQLNAYGSGTGCGVFCDGEGSATVSNASGGSSGAVWAKSGQITIDGDVTGTPAIVLGASRVEFSKSVGVPTVDAASEYYVYSDGSNTVRIILLTGAPGSGDLFARGYATMDVALVVARVVCGFSMIMTPKQFASVDMDGDGYLTMTDVLLIMRRACGL